TSSLLFQVARYGVVGSLASLTQFLVVVAFVSIHLLNPIPANLIGYLCGFVVSFTGHKKWTFTNSKKAMHEALPMFLLITGINFSLNQGCFYTFLAILHFHYCYALLSAMLIAAVVTFTLAKWVVFC